MYNVVLITIDSLRNDYVGFNNEEHSSKSLTPGLDKIAKDAYVFENAISQAPRTPEAFPALLSGIYSCRYLDMYTGLSKKRKLISEILKKQGYCTAAFNSNPYISRNMNYNRGFDLYEDNLFVIKNEGFIGDILINLFKLKSLLIEPYVAAPKINKQVQKWLNTKKDPYFLWVHYMDVHGPYISKKGWIAKNRIKAGILWRKASHKPETITEKEKRELISSYKEEIKYTDKHVCDLLEKIDSEKTIIIITADHGDCFGEHNLYSHKFALYDTLLRIPLIIKLPKKLEKKIPFKIDKMVKALDVVPTIAELLQIKHKYKFDGESLVSLMNGEVDKYSSEYVISELWTKYLSIRSDKWKYIANYNTGDKELYNIKKDKNENENVLDEFPDIAKKMEEKIKDHLIDLNASKEDLKEAGVDFNEAVKAQLKSLGYM